jgi:hypothetical protein
MSQRKRPWQALSVLVLPDGNKVRSRSFFNYRDALGWGQEWLQEQGPDSPHQPAVWVQHRDAMTTPEGELRPEAYRLFWTNRMIVQMTWPPLTPEEARRDLNRVMDRLGAGGESTKVRTLSRVVAVAPGGDPGLIGMDFQT